MIYRFTLFFAILFSVVLSAQKTLSGKVTNASGAPIPSASVTLEEAGKDAIISYGITDAKGNYKITFTTDATDISVQVKAFNHKSQTKKIKNNTQNLNFSLSSEVTEIKEVIIKSKLITKRGDTIAYDLKSFDTKNDRTLSDVLKRMPGFEVNKDGSILYQGQPLSKFYVEGKDLMEGGYGVVNNSLPKGAVAKVEVMENHQPVKILQGKVPTEQAAINIRLKNRVTMTGRGEVGSGIADPALWNVKLTPMFFSKKIQWLLNYKTNNMGEMVENEGGLFAMGIRWEGRRSNATQDKWVSVENAATPNLPEKRYLFNNVHYLSGNILINPFKNKEWEMKAIVSYTNNAVERASEVQTRFKDVNNTLSERKISNNFYTNKAKTELIFTKNAKKGFFKNTTSFSKFWNADRAITFFNNPLEATPQRNAAQALESPTVSVQNSLSTIIPIKEKMLNVMSYISYQKDQQDLFITPGNYVFFPDNMMNNLFSTERQLWQYFRSNTFETNHSASLGFSYRGWTFTPELGHNYTRNGIDAHLLGDNGNGYRPFGQNFDNEMVFINNQPYAQLGINYKSSALSMHINVPVKMNNISAEDPLRGLNKDFSKTTFEPSAFIQYEFASFWKARVFGSMGNSFANASMLYAGYIMSNAQSIGHMDTQNPLLQRFSRNGGARIEYRNPLNNLFFNVNYNVSKMTSNLISNPFNNNTGYSVISYLEKDNSTLSHSQSAEVGKYFPKFKSNLAVNFRNSSSVSDNYLNNEYFENKNTQQRAGMKLSNAYFSWLTLDYNFSLIWSKNNRQNLSTQNKGYHHGFTATVFPWDGHSVAFNWDQINTEQAGMAFKNGFFDLNYQFAWTKRKVDFELKWLNIANKNVFETIFDGAYSTTVSRINIRPSQVMLSVKFNFK